MSAEKKISGWYRKFLNNRMAIEGMLFEKELIVRGGRENPRAGLAVVAFIWLLASVLAAQWILRQGYLFGAADAHGFQLAASWLEYFASGSVLDLFRPVQSDAGFPARPPLYYLTYDPVLKFITSDLRWALILVNSL